MNDYSYFVRFDMINAYESGYVLHPQLEMAKLAKELSFDIENWEPVSIADCWMFWLKSMIKNIKFPHYITQLKYISYEDWQAGHVN
jgi:hypothetical protein